MLHRAENTREQGRGPVISCVDEKNIERNEGHESQGNESEAEYLVGKGKRHENGRRKGESYVSPKRYVPPVHAFHFDFRRSHGR